MNTSELLEQIESLGAMLQKFGGNILSNPNLADDAEIGIEIILKAAADVDVPGASIAAQVLPEIWQILSWLHQVNPTAQLSANQQPSVKLQDYLQNRFQTDAPKVEKSQ